MKFIKNINFSNIVERELKNEKLPLMTFSDYIRERRNIITFQPQNFATMFVHNYGPDHMPKWSMLQHSQQVLYKEEKLMERFIAWTHQEFEIHASMLKVYMNFFESGPAHFTLGMYHYYKTWQHIWLASGHQFLSTFFNPVECLKFETSMRNRVEFMRETALRNSDFFIEYFIKFHARDSIMLNENNLRDITDSVQRDHIRKMRARELISSIIIPEDIKKSYNISNNWSSAIIDPFFVDETSITTFSSMFNNFLSGKNTHDDVAILQFILSFSTENLEKMDFGAELQKVKKSQEFPVKPCTPFYNESVAAKYGYKEACDKCGIMEFNFCNKELDSKTLENLESFVGKLSLSALYVQRFKLIRKRIRFIINDIIEMTNNYYSNITRFRSREQIEINSLFVNTDVRAFGAVYGKSERVHDADELEEQLKWLNISERYVHFNYTESRFYDAEVKPRYSPDSLLQSMTKVREPNHVRCSWLLQSKCITKATYMDSVKNDELIFKEMLRRRETESVRSYAPKVHVKQMMKSKRFKHLPVEIQKQLRECRMKSLRNSKRSKNVKRELHDIVELELADSF